MEEKKTTTSDWKLRHNMYQTFRNYRQLQNRLNILQLEKKKKLKDIQNKLNSHKKFVQMKIYKHQLKQAIDNTQNQSFMRSTSNSRLFRAIQDSRNSNIKKKQSQIMNEKMKMFQLIKKKRIENQEKIKVSRLQSLDEKVTKRNRVRLIQIGCKQNIQNFWNTRLQSFQQEKKQQITKKLKIHQENLKRLQKLQKSQQQLIEQIKRTEEVQGELISMIQSQKVMDGGQLDNLYFSKVKISNNDQNN